MEICAQQKTTNRIMYTPLLTWGAMVSLFVIILLIRFCRNIYKYLKGHNLFEIGSEREEFYLPGDRLKYDDYDYNDFDDL
jgi:hypothetical protein